MSFKRHFLLLLFFCDNIFCEDAVNTQTHPTPEPPLANIVKTSENITYTKNTTDGEMQTRLQALAFLPPPLRDAILKLSESQNEYGHIEVREGAFLFWWLYYADGAKEEAQTKPLVIWIQGGPSIPGSGLGNFIEIGPLTVTLKKKPHSWVKGKNILFVDSPVGTGYSYVEREDLLCKKDKDVASDLIQLMKIFLNKFPEFKTTPTHIFSQSYGTKIASYFAYYMKKEIESGEVEMNLKTVALGGSWVDPKTTMSHVAEFLYEAGFLDKGEVTELRRKVTNLTGMLDRKEYREAFKYRLEIYEFMKFANYDGYNVFKPNSGDLIPKLMQFMNGFVPLYLGRNHVKKQWYFLNVDVIDALSPEFMKPAVHVVEKILSETDLRVVVYNGNLDSVTPISGAVSWVHDLVWSGGDAFWNATRQPLKGIMNGYFKEHDRLSLWWILKAGHWVPTDNPEAMDQLLQYIVHENKEFFTANAEDGATNSTKL